MDPGIDERCRLCLSTTDMIGDSIFEAREDDVSFSTKIMLCTGIMVSPEDEFSKCICNDCADMLELFFYFRKICFKSFVSLNNCQVNGMNESSNLVNYVHEEVKNYHKILYDRIRGKLNQAPEQTFLTSFNEKESDLGIDKVVSEEVVFEEEDDGKEAFTGRQFQVGCYVPLAENGSEKDSPLLRRFQCTSCKNVFPSIAELDDHWPVCEELTDTETPLRQLMDVVAQRDHTLYKDDIDESGNDEDCVAVKKKSKVKEFCCELCGQMFKQLRLLTKHRQVKHVGERPFVCSHCPKSFLDKYELKYHQRLHQDFEDFSCNFCGKRFDRRSGLRAHLRSHTGEKPYKCDTCGKFFAQLNSLNTHERTHTGVRPYKCNFCSRTFAQYSTAKSHEEMHMGGLRLYQCDVCDRMYKTEEELRTHSVTHEGSFDDDEEAFVLAEEARRRRQPTQSIPRVTGYTKQLVPSYSEVEFHSHFRMTPSTFEFILNLIGPQLTRATRGGNPMILPEKQLMMTLWRITTPDSFRSIHNRFNVGKATAVRAVRRCTEALAKLSSQFIQWPSGDRANEVIAGFSRVSAFPGAIGAIDGTHVQIPAPHVEPKGYINRKGFHSIQVQVVCDHRLLFTDVNAGHPGSIHDARVLSRSKVGQFLEDSAKFPNESHLLGDAAYPLHTHLMVPYPDNGLLTKQQKNFNFCHSSARVYVERAIGLLKMRWRSLLHCLAKESIEEIPVHIMAAAVLHNICILQGDELDVLHEAASHLQGEENPGEPHPNREEAVQKRDRICSTLRMRDV